MLTRSELLEAHREGAGYCLFCAHRNDELASPYASECENCGHLMVVPAAAILTFQSWLDLEESEE